MRKIKACKFCSSILTEVETMPNGKYYVVCFSCGACGSEHITKEQAIKAWNGKQEDKTN